MEFFIVTKVSLIIISCMFITSSGATRYEILVKNKFEDAAETTIQVTGGNHVEEDLGFGNSISWSVESSGSSKVVSECTVAWKTKQGKAREDSFVALDSVNPPKFVYAVQVDGIVRVSYFLADRGAYLFDQSGYEKHVNSQRAAGLQINSRVDNFLHLVKPWNVH